MQNFHCWVEKRYLLSIPGRSRDRSTVTPLACAVLPVHPRLSRAAPHAAFCTQKSPKASGVKHLWPFSSSLSGGWVIYRVFCCELVSQLQSTKTGQSRAGRFLNAFLQTAPPKSSLWKISLSLFVAERANTLPRWLTETCRRLRSCRSGAMLCSTTLKSSS